MDYRSRGAKILVTLQLMALEFLRQRSKSDKSSKRKSEGLWYGQIQEYDVHAASRDYTFEIILMAELTPDFSNVVDAFNNSVVNTAGVIKLISYKNFYDTIKACAANKKIDPKAEYALLFKKLCQKSMSHLKNGRRIPVDLLACQLKLLISIMIENDIESEIKDKKKPKTVRSSKTSSLLNVDIPPKHLFFVLNGFYDVDLIKEMWKVGLPFTAVLEVSDESLTFKSMEYLLRLGVYSGMQLENNNNGFEYILHHFWSTIYQYLETNPESEYLQNCIHMKAHTHYYHDQYEDQDTILDTYFIHNQILKIPDIKRQYFNYVKYLKLLNIDREKQLLSLKSLTVYNRVMNKIPSECFSIAYLLHAMILQVCSYEQIKISKNKKSLKCDSAVADFITSKLRSHKIDLLTHVCETSLLNLEIGTKGFIIDASNNLEYKLKCYPTLYKKLIKINQKSIRNNQTVLLWKNFSKDNLLSVLRVQLLGKIRSLLNQSPDQKIFYDVARSLFSSIPCTKHFVSDVEENVLREVCCAKVTDNCILKLEVRNNDSFGACEYAPDYGSSFTIPDEHNLSLYESINVDLYTWFEKFACEVMMQELQQALDEYECVDHKYNLLHDTLLLRFHHCSDGFGITTSRWDEFIRTPVCIRDFCKYVIDKDSDWLEDEEYCFNQNPCDLTTKRLYAYDIGSTIVQLEGATISFTSLDGYRITVDSTDFLGKTPFISVNVSIKDNNLIFHCPKKINKKVSVGFHYALHDGTIVAFTKSNLKPQLHFGEMIKSTYIEEPPKACNKKYVYVVETKLTGSNLVKTEIYPKSNKSFPIGISESETVPSEFENDSIASISNFGGKIDSNMFPSGSEKTFINFDGLIPFSSTSGVSTSLSNSTQKSESVELSAESGKFIPSNVHVGKLSDVELYLYGNTMPKQLRNKKSTSKTETSFDPAVEIQNLVKKIKYAKKLQIPWFRICSSPLHKHNYIKPIKSYICLNLEKFCVTLLCRHSVYKSVPIRSYVKLFPVHVRKTSSSKSTYDMKIILPTGLAIYSVSYTDDLLNIKQRYVEKGPHCKNLESEYSRMFMRNGYVSIRKTDGSVEIFTPSSEIYRFMLPYKIDKPVTRRKLVRKRIANRKLTKLEKKIWRAVQRRACHLVKTKKRYLQKRQKHKQRLHYEFVSTGGDLLRSSKLNCIGQTQIPVATHTDQQSQEHLVVRDDGTKLFLTVKGILTVEYKDHTKITSWPEIFFHETDDFADWVLIYVIVKFEHPKYATVTYHSYYESAKVELANGLQIDIARDGTFKINLLQTFSSSVNQEEVCIQTASCKKCDETNLTTINLKPLLSAKNELELDNEILLHSYDTYRKRFTIKYNGECERNSYYVDHAYNRRGCRNHNQEPHQKLFILNRNLSGIKLIDSKEFYKRLTTALVSSTTVTHDCLEEDHQCNEYHCFGLSKVVDKSYHSHFNFYQRPILATEEPQRQAPEIYTFIAHIHSIPLDENTTASLLETLASIYRNLSSDNKDHVFIKTIDSSTFQDLQEKRNAREFLGMSISRILDANKKTPMLSMFNSLITSKLNNIFPDMLGKTFPSESKQGQLLRFILDNFLEDPISKRVVEPVKIKCVCESKQSISRESTEHTYTEKSLGEPTKFICIKETTKSTAALKNKLGKTRRNVILCKKHLAQADLPPCLRSSKRYTSLISSKTESEGHSTEKIWSTTSSQLTRLIASVKKSSSKLREFDKRLEDNNEL